MQSGRLNLQFSLSNTRSSRSGLTSRSLARQRSSSLSQEPDLFFFLLPFSFFFAPRIGNRITFRYGDGTVANGGAFLKRLTWALFFPREKIKKTSECDGFQMNVTGHDGTRHTEAAKRVIWSSEPSPG